MCRIKCQFSLFEDQITFIRLKKIFSKEEEENVFFSLALVLTFSIYTEENAHKIHMACSSSSFIICAKHSLPPNKR